MCDNAAIKRCPAQYRKKKKKDDGIGMMIDRVRDTATVTGSGTALPVASSRPIAHAYEYTHMPMDLQEMAILPLTM